MNATRKAVMKVYRELLEQLMPDWETRVRARYGDMVDGRAVSDVEAIAAPYHAALKLPANCRITGISHNHYFNIDEIAFRIESPDFVETQEAHPLPEVRAVYQSIPLHDCEPGLAPTYQRVAACDGYFLRWDGPAVEMRRTWGPDGIEETIEFDFVKRVVDGVPEIERVKLVSGRKLSSMEHVVHDHDGLPLGPLENDTNVGGQSAQGDWSGTTLKGLPVFITDWSAPCWRCHSPTIRRLPDWTAECQVCSEKPML